MKTVALVLAATLTGCVFHTKDTTSLRVVDIETAVNPVPIRSGGLKLQAQAHDSTIRINATLDQTCSRDLVENLELTRGKKLALWRIDDSGYILLFAFMLAPITLPISGLISAIDLNTHHDTITKERRVTPNGFQPCPRPDSISIQLVLPSGAIASVVTASDGTATFELPAEEPERGMVTISNGAPGVGGAAVQVSYYRSYQACVDDRRAQLELANVAPSGRTQLLGRLPHCGAVTTGANPTAERAWELASDAAVAASTGICRPVFDAQAEIQRLDPQLHAAIYGHREVMTCVAREAERRKFMSECQLRRGDAMRAAQTITNARKRGAALLQIEKCKPLDF